MFQFGNSDCNMLVSAKKLNKYCSDEMTLDINNPNDSHSIIAKNIKENSVCLDVGCGVGYIGELLKKHRNAKIDGIEIDEESIKILKEKKCYDKIYNIYISPNSSEYNKFINNDKKYDYIIFADVIEHLIDVGQIIFDFSKKLKKNGKMIVSIPNIAHFDIIKNLSDGKFNYNTTGILDNTHLRFFTKNSFMEMINKINEIYNTKLFVKVIDKTIVETGYLEHYPNVYSSFNKEGEGCVVQYIYEIEINAEKAKNLSIIYNTNHFDDIEKKFKEINNENKNNISKLKHRIDELEKELNESNKRIIELNNELEIKNKSIEELNNGLEIKNKSIEELNNGLEIKNRNIEELNNELEIKNKSIEELNNELEIKNKNIEELNKIYSNYIDVINSKSWKSTAIFRKISSLIRKKVK